MKTTNKLISGFFLLLIAFSHNLAKAQTWAQVGPTNYLLTSVAASPDGNSIYVTSTNLIVSRDRGATWTNAAVPGGPYFNWVTTGAFGNGSNVMLGPSYSSQYFLSSDAGQTWRLGGSLGFSAAAMSANGSNILAIGSTLYHSADGGNTWTTNNLPDSTWSAVAICSNGTVMAAVDTGGFVYVSTNGAASWFSNSLAGGLAGASIACSADGSRLVVSSSGNGSPVTFSASGYSIFLSTNSGGTWQTTATPAVQWRQVTCSANGNRINAVSHDGCVFTSPDGGQTWAYISNPVLPWSGLAASADGSSLAAITFTVAGAVPECNLYIYSTPLVPALQVLYSGAQAALTWPSTSLGCALQQSSSLSPAAWTTLTNPVAQVNQVIVSAPGASSFFRLKQP